MSTPLRILHLEDEPADSELVAACLTAEGVEHVINRVDTPAAFEAALERGGFDLILADQTLPGYTGQAALELAQRLRPEAPFIFVSGDLSEDQAIEMLRQGATDYVFKQRLGRLPPVVARALHEFAERAEHRRADERVQQQAQREAQLAQASRAFAAASNNYQQVLAAVTRTVHELTGDACTIRLLSDDGHWLQHVVTYHPNAEAQALEAELKAAPLPFLDEIVGQRVKPGQSLRLPELTPELLRTFVPEPLWPLLDRFPIYSALAVPLRVRGESRGALILTRGVPGRSYTEADQAFVERLADHAALAIDNARTFEAEQAARRASQVAATRIARLQSVTAALTAPASAREVAEVITQQSQSALGASAVSLYLLEPDGEWLNMVASVGFPEPVRQAIGRLAVGSDMPAADIYRSQRPLWLRSNAELVARYPKLGSTRAVTRNEALAVLPLSGPNLALGVLSVSFSEVRDFGPEDQDFLLAMASLAAQAMERGRLYDTERQLRGAEREAQERLAFLAATSAALSESLDFETTLQRLAQQMVPYLADWCLVDLLTEDAQLLLMAVAHVRPGREALVRQARAVYPPSPTGALPIWQVIKTLQPLLTPVITPDDLAARAQNAEHLGWLQALDIRSHVIVPLVARGHALGVLSLVRTSASPAYTPADLALAEEVARRAAQAIDNARLFREAQTLNAFLEHRVVERTSELAAALTSATQANRDLEQEVGERRVAEARFRHLLENAPDATVIVDAAGIIVLANSQTQPMFGYHAEELVGQPVERLIPARFTARHREHRRGYAAAPHPRPMGAGLDLYGRRQDGSEFPIEVSLGPLQVDTGLLISCSIRDITRRKQIADELRASHEQLQALMSRVQAVREDERALLAREVHDELGQLLSGLKMDVAWLRKRMSADATVAAKFEGMADLLDTTIKTVRHIATELRPGLLDDFGLLAAIEWQLSEFEKRSGLPTTLTSNVDELQLPPDTTIAVFRVFQESLTNIARHAQASAVTVTIDARPTEIKLEVHDDGQGFDIGAVGQKRSLGLAGMRERVQAFAGQLVVDSAPGAGTTIRVSIPGEQREVSEADEDGTG